jgi:hypothetical protein
MQIEGQLIPIVVDIAPNGKYTLIDGECRLMAAKRLHWKTLDCVLWDTLDEDTRRELELILCIRRKSLSFLEEARAVKEIVNRKKDKMRKGSGMAKFGMRILDKDIAAELSITPTKMSECLRIADAVEEHPELECNCKTKRDMLTRIRNQDYTVLSGGSMHRNLKESLIYSTPIGCLDTVGDKIIDFIILHAADTTDEMLENIKGKTKPIAQLIVFLDIAEVPEMTARLKKFGWNLGNKPYIFHDKKTDDYKSYLWAGKNITNPIGYLETLISDSPHNPMSAKALAPKLITALIKCCSLRNGFIVVPTCEDTQTVTIAMDLGRHIRAACGNKPLRDRLLLNAVENTYDDN